MNFLNRIRFLIGLILVALVVGLLVLYLNNAMSTVHTNKAELGADATTVGADYSGLLTKQAVSDGDQVYKGQALFTISSPQLAASIANGSVTAATLPFKVAPMTGDIAIVANDNGVIEKVHYLKGSYVPAGSVLATIDTVDTSFISGHFHLSPPNYARVRKGNTMDVTFPDNSKGVANVYSVALSKDGNVVDTIVKARLQPSTTARLTFPIGTPVEASLKLVHRTWFQDVTNFLHSLFKPAAA